MQQPMHQRFPEKFSAITQDQAVLRRPSYEVDPSKPEELIKCQALAEEMSNLLFINQILTGPDGKEIKGMLGADALAPVFKNILFDGNNIIGYGLAARQLKSQEAVDTPRLSAVVLTRVVNKEGRTIQPGELLWMVNPQILRSSMMKRYKQEGCLSMPGVYYNTDRHMIATVGFLDLKKLLVDPDPLKAAREIEFAGVEAVVMQHEIDHHDGRLFTDHARTPEAATKKIGANEPCPECLKNGKTIKWKKCNEHNPD